MGCLLNRDIVGFLTFILIAMVALISTASVAAVSNVQLIVNDHAMGISGDLCPQTHDPNVEAAGDGWNYNQYMTLSKCGNKNSDSGAMFKNGPAQFSGQGQPNVPAEMWQDYDMAALGFGGSDIDYIFEAEVVSVGGTSFDALIYSSQDGVNFSNPVSILDWPSDNCGIGSKYPKYCHSGTLAYAPYLRLELASIWNQQLGQKWANISLVVSDGGISPTATPFPTITGTTIPTATSEATMTPTPLSTPTPCHRRHC